MREPEEANTLPRHRSRVSAVACGVGSTYVIAFVPLHNSDGPSGETDGAFQPVGHQAGVAGLSSTWLLEALGVSMPVGDAALPSCAAAISLLAHMQRLATCYLPVGELAVGFPNDGIADSTADEKAVAVCKRAYSRPYCIAPDDTALYSIADLIRELLSCSAGGGPPEVIVNRRHIILGAIYCSLRLLKANLHTWAKARSAAATKRQGSTAVAGSSSASADRTTVVWWRTIVDVARRSLNDRFADLHELLYELADEDVAMRRLDRLVGLSGPVVAGGTSASDAVRVRLVVAIQQEAADALRFGFPIFYPTQIARRHVFWQVSASQLSPGANSLLFGALLDRLTLDDSMARLIQHVFASAHGSDALESRVSLSAAFTGDIDDSMLDCILERLLERVSAHFETTLGDVVLGVSAESPFSRLLETLQTHLLSLWVTDTERVLLSGRRVSSFLDGAFVSVSYDDAARSRPHRCLLFHACRLVRAGASHVSKLAAAWVRPKDAAFYSRACAAGRVGILSSILPALLASLVSAVPQPEFVTELLEPVRDLVVVCDAALRSLGSVGDAERPGTEDSLAVMKALLGHCVVLAAMLTGKFAGALVVSIPVSVDELRLQHWADWKALSGGLGDAALDRQPAAPCHEFVKAISLSRRTAPVDRGAPDGVFDDGPVNFASDGVRSRSPSPPRSRSGRVGSGGRHGPASVPHAGARSPTRPMSVSASPSPSVKVRRGLPASPSLDNLITDSDRSAFLAILCGSWTTSDQSAVNDLHMWMLAHLLMRSSVQSTSSPLLAKSDDEAGLSVPATLVAACRRVRASRKSDVDGASDDFVTAAFRILDSIDFGVRSVVAVLLQASGMVEVALMTARTKPLSR